MQINFLKKRLASNGGTEIGEKKKKRRTKAMQKLFRDKKSTSELWTA